MSWKFCCARGHLLYGIWACAMKDKEKVYPQGESCRRRRWSWKYCGNKSSLALIKKLRNHELLMGLLHQHKFLRSKSVVLFCSACIGWSARTFDTNFHAPLRMNYNNSFFILHHQVKVWICPSAYSYQPQPYFLVPINKCYYADTIETGQQSRSTFQHIFLSSLTNSCDKFVS